MTKAYVVTSGSYSDYSIDRVFLDKEKAERYIKLCDNHGDTPIIEEYDIDDNNSIDEIVYVEGKHYKNQVSIFKNKEMDVSIKRTNSLDDEPQEIKRNWFHINYDESYSLTIRRVLSNGSFDEKKIIKKYEKVLYDLMAQVEYLMSTGWDGRMIQEWFNQKSDEYIENTK